MYTAFIFFAAAADLFLTIRVWYILEDKDKVEVIKDGNRAYVIKQVIKTNRMINTDDCESESQQEEEMEIEEENESISATMFN